MHHRTRSSMFPQNNCLEQRRRHSRESAGSSKQPQGPREGLGSLTKDPAGTLGSELPVSHPISASTLHLSCSQSAPLSLVYVGGSKCDFLHKDTFASKHKILKLLQFGWIIIYLFIQQACIKHPLCAKSSANF